MKKPYLESDVLKSYKWLGHRQFTELNAYHPDYRRGREHFKENLENDALPKIWYAREEQAVMQFVERYAGQRTVCFGINPRQRILRNRRGYARSAFEHKIETVQNMLFDLDFDGESFSETRVAQVNAFIQKSYQYFRDLGMKVPTKAYTGRGFHLLFAIPETGVQENPDIADRQKAFADGFRQAYRRELGNLELRLDSTQDLRRMARIYGTAKPDVGIISRFYGQERDEDGVLKDYLMCMDLDSLAAETAFRGGSDRGLELEVGSELPQWFQSIVQQDKRIRELWDGTGKTDERDTTRSGYDYSLVRALLKQGYRNLDELATILALRPEGGIQESGKSEQYIRRTIANAILK